MYRRPGFGNYLLVNTRRTQNTGLFWAHTGAMDTGVIKSGRPAVELLNISLAANMAVLVGWQESDDAIVWPLSTDTPGLFDYQSGSPVQSVRSAEGIYFSTLWETLTFTKRFVRFGTWVYNPTNTALESCLTAIRVDTRSF